ncbi:type IV pilus modification protein PilV [Massilia yuzhufengensis]|uniref:Type IV pilus assembly protein PilV n=1 Tax=Massilia yuzhufengensis TaxID=1164594 RepID=A0A1I1JZA6_9BURK|nr:type IV pilus modification protein PilV [Massilia yuzhufengensis]SFC53591.1 type IV pilus assembly protein PilV [Massilia yuzhufengensis]
MRARMHGFTLVEVLVALFVLAVGVVGAGATQLTAERTRQQSALISEAAQLAASLAARMQVNPSVSRLPDASNPYLTFSYDAAGGMPSAPALCFGGTSCTPAQLAEFDLYEMRQALHAQFPRGRIEVCRDGSPWDSAVRRYRWSCDGAAGALPVVKLGWQGEGDAPAYVGVLQ